MRVNTGQRHVAAIGAKPVAALVDEPAIGLSEEDYYDAELAQMHAEYLAALLAEVKSLNAEIELMPA
jgi:hypothetical protein